MDNGLKLLSMILRSQEWVHRRVDKLMLTTAGSTRRSVSLDVTIPPDWLIPGSRERCIVPLGLLRKQPLRGLDTVGPDGKSFSVLTSEQNGRLTTELLESAMLAIAPDANSEEIRRLAEDVVMCDADEVDTVLDLFHCWCSSVESSPGWAPESAAALELVSQMAETFSRNFVLLVEVDEAWSGKRGVLKYSSYQDELHEAGGLPGTLLSFEVEVPDLGFARSQHVEVIAPLGTVVPQLAMEWTNPDGSQYFAAEPQGSKRSLAHVNSSQADRFALGRIRFEVCPAAGGLQAFTDASMVFVVMVILSSIGLRIFPLLGATFTIPSPAVSILLSGPALMLSWLARSPENRVASRCLAPLRWLNVSGAIQLLLVAGLAAVPLTVSVWHAAWLLVYALTFLTALAWVVMRFAVKQNFHRIISRGL